MIDGTFTPMSEEEKELFEEIYQVTREAQNNGVSKVRIASMLAYFSATAIDPKSLDAEDEQVQQDTHDLEERLNGEPDSEQVVCPSCKEKDTYTEISDVRAQLGGQFIVEPCGCVVEYENRDELGRWVEQYEVNDEHESSSAD